MVKEINQIQNEHYHSQMRKELLDTQNDLQAGLRKRGGNSINSSDNMGQAMKYYGDMQEKIAEDMLSLTRSLKEQTEIANKIIRRDTEVSRNNYESVCEFLRQLDNKISPIPMSYSFRLVIFDEIGVEVGSPKHFFRNNSGKEYS